MSPSTSAEEPTRAQRSQQVFQTCLKPKPENQMGSPRFLNLIINFPISHIYSRLSLQVYVETNKQKNQWQ